MIFTTAMTIGVAAGLCRSVTTVVAAGLLILLVFGLAAILSPGPPSLLALLAAIAGYNLGLFNLVLAMLALAQPRSA